MRILHISTRLILGGSQENTVLSCEGQSRRGHEVYLAFGPIYGPEGSLLERVQAFNSRAAAGEEPTPDGGRATPIGLHETPHLIRPIRPYADTRCYFDLGRLIEGLGPDIVHTHSSKAGVLGRAAAWAVWKRSIASAPDRAPAVVHTVHGSPFHDYQSRAAHRLYVASERFAAHRCHTIVSVADAMTSQYIREGIGRAEQYVTVYSGMETDLFLDARPGESRADARGALGLKPDDFVVGTVARLAELKGHDDLLDALGERLRADGRWKFLWVGDGWWRERLIDRARARGLEVAELDRAGDTPSRAPGTSATDTSKASILLTGLVPPQRVPAIIRAMDVLAHPSYREGLPRTVPQALLSGVCPVVYDVDGAGEVCRDGQTGRLVPPGDTGALRDAILWLYDHADERRAMAEQGRTECAQRFSARAMVDRLERVYADALALARDRRGVHRVERSGARPEAGP